MIGTSQPRHLAQVVGNRLGLPAFLGVNSGIGAVGIHQRENRPAELFRNLHHAQRLAITLRMRRAKIAVDALLHVPPLLGADHQNFLAVKAGHAADDRRIVAEAAVAVNLAPVGEHALDVVEGLRTLGMPGQFRLLPGRLQRLHLLPQDVDALLQLRQLAVSLFVLTGVASISATCRSICSSSCCAFSVFHDSITLTDHAS